MQEQWVCAKCGADFTLDDALIYDDPLALQQLAARYHLLHIGRIGVISNIYGHVAHRSCWNGIDDKVGFGTRLI